MSFIPSSRDESWNERTSGRTDGSRGLGIENITIDVHVIDDRGDLPMQKHFVYNFFMNRSIVNIIFFHFTIIFEVKLERYPLFFNYSVDRD